MAKAGDRLPDITLRRLGESGIEAISTSDLFGGKKVVLFGVPGAFTPTCEDAHLPGYVVRADDLRAKGADLVACVAVNDPFVMAAWGKARGVEGIEMLSDGNADLARSMGLQLDLSMIGLGVRNQRFASIIDDMVITYLGVEPGREVTVSSVEEVLYRLGQE